MKLTFNLFEKPAEDENKRWPRYVFGGRFRTSTLALIMAFCALQWVQATSAKTTPPQPPPPPGYTTDNKGGNGSYIPDPNSDYTVVPRTRVQPPSPTTTPPTVPPTTTTTTTTPPFVLPTLPCIPPFCNPNTTPNPPSPGPAQQPPPGPGPVPTSAPPAR
ncbi:hypothetical protein [Mycobacterium sp.]|uniref:hypothetical protein n=1 Tax=Mycobacterium sp. TaxID=1785 RepID=UPI002B523523|nr:hypothetical protein [Mycobacterium sp.]HTQ16937.1 hypothetical protein [Mycobacterium sp.]